MNERGVCKYAVTLHRNGISKDWNFIMKKTTILLLMFCCLTMEFRTGSAETLEKILSEPYVVKASSPVEGFTMFGGMWRLENGVIHGAAGAGNRLVLNGTPTENVSFSVEIFLEAGKSGNAAIVTNDSQDGVGADSFNGYEFALYAREQNVMLGRHQQNFQTLAAAPCRIPEGEWVSVRAECRRVPEGNRLSLFVNGEKAAEVLDENPLPPGSVALRPWQRDVQYRNLEIDGLKQDLRAVEDKIAAYPETLRTEMLPPILVNCRPAFGRPPAVGLDFWASPVLKWGCALKRIYPAEPQRETETIFSDPDGMIYDMNLSFDAQTVFFSYRRKEERFWKIYRIGIDGKGLKQLTFGEGYDFSPAELPTGEIVFVSTRRGGFTVCQPGPASNLYKMNADGSDIRCISMNTLSDFHPQVLPDGRILFTRWEYIDRDLTYRQSLWTENPDGTNYQLFFGNTVRSVGSFLQARPVPGRSGEVIATFAPHHGFPQGALGMIRSNYGPETAVDVGYECLTKEFFPVGDSSREWAYRDPFPVSENQYLCSYGSDRGGSARYRLYLMNREGEKRLLYEDSDPSRGCYCAQAIRPVPLPLEVAPKQNGPRKNGTGTLLLANVNEGLFPFVKPGEVVKIRIMEQVRKSEDLKNRAYDQSPLMSCATYYAKRCWGEVPVETDGSAYFEVPALREIYLQAVDREGREVQRMTSALQLMPGEVLSCVGCHENRVSTPVSLKNAVQPLAAGREPSQPEMPEWWNEIAPANDRLDRKILNYVTLVQPVWDRYCIECHSGKNPDGGYDLTGDKTRFFCESYDNLTGKSRSYRQHDMFSGRMLPEEAQREKPLVQFYWLLWTPSGVNQPLEAGFRASRLGDYMTREHCGKEMSRADRERVALWVDANIPYYATYANSRPETAGKRDLFQCEAFQRDFFEVYERRCASCHQEFHHNDTPSGPANPTTVWNGRFAWVNFTHPENSAVLTAHLPKPAGRGISTLAEGKPETFLFRDESDADYQKLLSAIRAGQTAMLANPRADMPGFRNAKPED